MLQYFVLKIIFLMTLSCSYVAVNVTPMSLAKKISEMKIHISAVNLSVNLFSNEMGMAPEINQQIADRVIDKIADAIKAKNQLENTRPTTVPNIADEIFSNEDYLVKKNVTGLLNDEIRKSMRRMIDNKINERSSTSAESDENPDAEENPPDDSSIGISVASSNDDKNMPKSSKERKGWRKWHRKCYQCPELKTKSNDRTLPWICGAYQRALRSFKSPCMMRYRNCQDGTMFVKIRDGRCNPPHPERHGEHFFYDDDEDRDSTDTTSTEEESTSLDSRASAPMQVFTKGWSLARSFGRRHKRWAVAVTKSGAVD